MGTHSIGFYEGISKLSLNYHQISSNTHLISSAGLVMSSMVGNPKDRFSHDMAHMCVYKNHPCLSPKYVNKFAASRKKLSSGLPIRSNTNNHKPAAQPHKLARGLRE